MVVIRGSRSGVGNLERTGPSDEICGIIAAAVAMASREAIPELFGFIKTALIEEFDGCYVVVMQVATAATTIVVTDVGLQEM